MKENHIAMTILVTVSITAALGLVFLFNSEQTAQVVVYSYGQEKVYGGGARPASTPIGPALERQGGRQLGGHYLQYTPETIYVTASPGARVATYGKDLSKIPSLVSETGGCPYQLNPNDVPTLGVIEPNYNRARSKYSDELGNFLCHEARNLQGSLLYPIRYCCPQVRQSSLPGSI